MKIPYNLLLICLFFLNIFCAKAQISDSVEVDKLSLGKVKTQAKSALSVGDSYVALPLYKKWHAQNPADSKVAFQLAELYRITRDYKNAESMYSAVYAKSPDDYPLALFYKGVMQKTNGDIEGARASFDAFKKVMSAVPKELNIIRAYKNEVSGLDLVESFDKNRVKEYKVKRLGDDINAPHIESNPIVVDDNTIYYTSSKAGRNVYYKRDNEEDQGTFESRKLYVAKKSGQDNWTDGGEISTSFYEDGVDIANGSFSYDKKRFYVSKCQKNLNNEVVCELYVANYSNGAFSALKLLPTSINKAGSTSTQPTVGVDPTTGKEILYFVSNRPGSKGSTDIWASEYDVARDSYSEAVNCGKNVNTFGTEMTPWYDNETQTLYFSSDGHPSIGGLDIFKNVGSKSSFNESSINLGDAINSSYDDLYFTLRDDKETGFFTSNRPGGAALLSETCCDDLYYFGEGGKLLAGKVIDKYSKECVDQTQLQLFELNASNQYTLVKTKESEECDFDFVIDPAKKYKIEATKAGYVPLTKIIDPTKDLSNFVLELEPERRFSGNIVNANTGNCLDGTKVELYVFDDVKNEYELVEQANNANCNISFARLLPPNKKVKVNIEKPGFEPFEKVFVPGEPISGITLPLVPLMQWPPNSGFTIKKGQPIVLNDIYFDFDKWDLKPRSIKVLDSLLIPFLSTYPNAIIEVSAHTDSFGSDFYNYDLSRKRALSVKEYLITKGVNINRLLSIGYGEDKPIDTNETEAGRAKNRRVEFRVIGNSVYKSGTKQEVLYNQE